MLAGAEWPGSSLGCMECRKLSQRAQAVDKPIEILDHLSLDFSSCRKILVPQVVHSFLKECFTSLSTAKQTLSNQQQYLEARVLTHDPGNSAYYADISKRTVAITLLTTATK